MTDEFDNEERELQRLFDATAEDASGPLLTRLAARAADVPARAKRPLWRSLWVWGPGLAVGAGALALAVGTLSHAPPGTVPRPSAVAMTAPEPRASAPAPVTTPAPAATSEDVPALDVVAGLEGDDLDSNADLGVSALGGPPPDADMDAWLYATGELLDNGGT